MEHAHACLHRKQLCICRTLILCQLRTSADCCDRRNSGGFFCWGKRSKEDDQKTHHAPARIPTILNSNSGTSEKRSPLMDFSNRQAAHVTIWPASRPMGTPFALCRIPCRITKYFTCFLDAPRQRSSP